MPSPSLIMRMLVRRRSAVLALALALAAPDAANAAPRARKIRKTDRRAVRTKHAKAKARASGPRFKEFRIVNWNAAGKGRNNGRDVQVATFVLEKVEFLAANVVTLQEVTEDSLAVIKGGLGRRWACRFQRFGVDGIATCVKGEARNLVWKRLDGIKHGPKGDWWGYVQLEYKGVKITNVHTRSHWKDKHVAELHKDIKAGIIAGDFNHTNPGFYQTDLDLEPTHKDRKIDHVVTVQKPRRVWGDAQQTGGSDHNVLLTKVTPGPQPLDPVLIMRLCCAEAG